MNNVYQLINVSFVGSPNKQPRLSIHRVLKVIKDQKPFQRNRNLFLIQCRTNGPVLEHRGLHHLRDLPRHEPPHKRDPLLHHRDPYRPLPVRLNLCPLLGSDQGLSPSIDILALCHHLVMVAARVICHQHC